MRTGHRHRHAPRGTPRAQRAHTGGRRGEKLIGAFRAFGHKLYGKGPYMKQNVAN